MRSSVRSYKDGVFEQMVKASAVREFRLEVLGTSQK
jgi:hypothetical protein